MTSGDYPSVVICGPTASGKSQLGMALAYRFRGEIISCDALQVYRHMNIGTAKAKSAELQMVPHHLLDLREPDQDFSAGDYQRLGREVLQDIRRRAQVPFVVGGTGFYLRALIDGLFAGPGRSEVLRSRLWRIVRRRGSNALHRALCRADPFAARRIALADIPRMIRAYEVYHLTGKPISWWQGQQSTALLGFRWLKLGISWPREVLYQRINNRVEEMFRKGFVEEVRILLESYPRDCHAFKAIGYRQVADHLEGRSTLEEAMEKTRLESRRYAKRQLTWFRALKDISWLDASRGWNAIEDQAAGQLAEFLEL
jgi:tRNA dimethylallyltransferase